MGVEGSDLLMNDSKPVRVSERRREKETGSSCPGRGGAADWGETCPLLSL